MIYSAGKNCPICFDSSDLIFLRNITSNKVFVSCYSCGCAWDHLPDEESRIDFTPLDYAWKGFALANFQDIASAGFASDIFEELSEDDLLFDGDEGFVPPQRNPQDYHGKTITVTMASPLEDGKKDWGVLIGKLRYETDKLILDIDSAPEQFEIENEWLCRIKKMYSGMLPPYSETELSLSLAIRAFPNDTPPQKLMKIARKRYSMNTA